MSKNAPECEGAFLVVEKHYQKIFEKPIDNGLWVL